MRSESLEAGFMMTAFDKSCKWYLHQLFFSRVYEKVHYQSIRWERYKQPWVQV